MIQYGYFLFVIEIVEVIEIVTMILKSMVIVKTVIVVARVMLRKLTVLIIPSSRGSTSNSSNRNRDEQ